MRGPLPALLVLATLAGSAPARASAQDPGDSVPAQDDPLTVYLVTMGPGDAVWERFGHNAIWIHDERTGEDAVWNWGLFSFSQEGFIPRLIRGEMLYAMGGFSMEATLAEYRGRNRPVWAQELELTPSQEAELDRLIRLNAQPENRYYRYDYYRDNCSTRVRDMLDAVLGGALKRRWASVPTGTTWRWHTLRLLRGDPWPRTGVQIVLGEPGDETIDAWQEMFIPMKVRAFAAETTITGAGGVERPLVRRETQLLDSTRGPVPSEPRSHVVQFLLLGLVGAAMVALLGLAAPRSGAVGRLSGALCALWCLIAGFAGTVLLGSYLTDHVFWRPNENLFQASPLHVALGLAAALLVFRGRMPRWGVAVARAVAVLSAAGLVLKVLPGFHQGNLEIVAFALPLNQAVAWTLGRLGRTGRPDAEAAASSREVRAAA